MTALRYFTAGESHGKALVGIIEGIPAGLELFADDINIQLKRRQMGYGRGGRMLIETDTAQILTGVRHGKTLGSPITIMIENKDWQNWVNSMKPDLPVHEVQKLETPRPGHADFAGALKYRHDDIRNILERASARETACRVAMGSIARKLIHTFGIQIASHVVRVKDIDCSLPVRGLTVEEINKNADASPIRCLNREKEDSIKKLVDEAKEKGDSLGGVVEVIGTGVPVGLGSHVQWDRKLDGRIAQAFMSLQAVKGVEIGLGAGYILDFGSQVHDQIYVTAPDGAPSERKFYRITNNAGGIEGGISNGEPILVRFFLKPLSTLPTPLDSVNLYQKTHAKAHRERTDTFVLPAAGVIGEALLSFVLAEALLEKFGGDSIEEIKERIKKDDPYLFPLR